MGDKGAELSGIGDVSAGLEVMAEGVGFADEGFAGGGAGGDIHGLSQIAAGGDEQGQGIGKAAQHRKVIGSAQYRDFEKERFLEASGGFGQGENFPDKYK